MIAVVCSHAELAVPLANTVGRASFGVDGPVAVWESPGLGGEPWRIYVGAPGRDLLYAVGRVAARREARVLILLTQAQVTQEFLDQSDAAPGDLLLPGRIQDMAALNDLQSLCPDTVDRLPVPFPASCPGEAYETVLGGPENGLVLGSLVFPLTVPLLARKSFKQWGVGIFETGGVGLARAARDAKCPFLVACLVDKAIAPGFAPVESSFLRHRRLARGVRDFVDQFGSDEPGTTPRG